MSKPRSGNILVRDDGYKGGRLYASLKEVQAVWAMVTEEPSISIRRIKCKLGVSKDRAWHILNFLQRAGYIKRKAHCNGRKVLIPFVIEKGTALKSKPLTESLTEQPKIRLYQLT